MRPEEIIQAARRGFEASLIENTFYNRQTKDDQHLRAILDFLPIRDDMRILDPGTGSGYLAFALAKRYPRASVTGPDIVAQTLSRDRETKEQEGLCNLRFVRCNGITLTFDSSIRFPRKMGPVYQEILLQYDPAVIAGYAAEIVNDEIFVTEKVNNLLFRN